MIFISFRKEEKNKEPNENSFMRIPEIQETLGNHLSWLIKVIYANYILINMSILDYVLTEPYLACYYGVWKLN